MSYAPIPPPSPGLGNPLNARFTHELPGALPYYGPTMQTLLRQHATTQNVVPAPYTIPAAHVPGSYLPRRPATRPNPTATQGVMPPPLAQRPAGPVQGFQDSAAYIAGYAGSTDPVYAEFRRAIFNAVAPYTTIDDRQKAYRQAVLKYFYLLPPGNWSTERLAHWAGVPLNVGIITNDVVRSLGAHLRDEHSQNPGLIGDVQHVQLPRGGVVRVVPWGLTSFYDAFVAGVEATGNADSQIKVAANIVQNLHRLPNGFYDADFFRNVLKHSTMEHHPDLHHKRLPHLLASAYNKQPAGEQGISHRLGSGSAGYSGFTVLQ